MIGAYAALAAIPLGLWLFMELDARRWRRREHARRQRRQAWHAWGDELDERRRRRRSAAAARPAPPNEGPFARALREAGDPPRGSRVGDPWEPIERGEP